MAYAFRAVAPALQTLLGQLNALAPNRSKLSDGALGDQAHAARFSFHNPNSSGIVQARDFGHDPAGGLDCNWLASALTASGDKRIHEIIWNRRYWTPAGGWVPYKGTNPHDKHLHVTVRSDVKLYNSTAPWNLAGPSGAPTPQQQEDDDVSMANDPALRGAITEISGNTRSTNGEVARNAIRLERIIAALEVRPVDAESIAKRVAELIGTDAFVDRIAEKVDGVSVEQVREALADVVDDIRLTIA